MSESTAPAVEITGSRDMYGTVSIYTTPHRGETGTFTVDFDEYHWHNGDAVTWYIEAEGTMVKKNGEHGNRRIRDLRKPPENVMAEFRRIRAAAGYQEAGSA